MFPTSWSCFRAIGLAALAAAPAGAGVDIRGYMDHELEWNEGSGATFDQHRFVPLLASDVSERVRVEAEIEFEHGGFVTGSEGADGEIKLEYAVLDFEITEAFVYRAGLILSPLGAFNLHHDSPLNDLTDRPIVARELVPSTLSEAGMGVYGEVYPSASTVLSYAAYVVNGFDGRVITGDGEDARLRIRSGRGSRKSDNNEAKSIVARLALSPAIGTRVGASVHTGAYDDAGDHRLTIVDLEGFVTRGALELEGEYAIAAAEVDRGSYPNAAERQHGAYGQLSVHVLPDAILSGSVVTLALRGDRVDFDADVHGDVEEVVTAGVNFRPTEATVFKLDHAWGWKTPRGGERGALARRVFFSIASYF